MKMQHETLFSHTSNDEERREREREKIASIKYGFCLEICTTIYACIPWM